MQSKADELALVRAAVHTTPIIDNHAHNLLKRSSLSTHPLLSILTEAGGPALEQSKTSLAHHRGVAGLAEALGCEATWDVVEGRIKEKWASEKAWKEWCQVCLEGIGCVLVDDGLGGDVESYSYFDEFTTQGKSKRIFRIEPFIEKVIKDAILGEVFEGVPASFSEVVNMFEEAVVDSLRDEEVVGFKSVICYRTGLDVPRVEDFDKAKAVFEELVIDHIQGVAVFSRLQHKDLNNYFVHNLAYLIDNYAEDGIPAKPIQFHTGLGDNDLTLTRASAAHLQDFARTHDQVPIVLLHGSYPFTREAGYLATTYANVYLDFGEIFPFLSRAGQEEVVRGMLDLVPAEKLLFSTDGHFFPETYLLAVKQMRQVLGDVLVEYVARGDLTGVQAASMVEDMLFGNANRLYKLDLEMVKLTKGEVATSVNAGDQLHLLKAALKGNEAAKFLRIYWHDMTGTARTKAIPIRRALSLLENGEELSLGVTCAGLCLTQLDSLPPGISPSGEWRLHPVLSTVKSWVRKEHVVARGVFRYDGGEPVTLCPRTLLCSVLDKARAQGLEFTLGFEIELVIMRRDPKGGVLPLDGDGHAWSVARAMDHPATKAIEEAIEHLEQTGVCVELLHPESANGQYEVVLGKGPALEALDNLVYAREVLASFVSAAGYKMTLHPKPYAMMAGTAAHVHMSLSGPDGHEVEEGVWKSFYAGVLGRLRSLSALTYSSVASYDRVQDGVWAGGTWIAWGTQNREAPLRKVAGSHWEMKCLDGAANPYIALASILGAGARGVEEGDSLRHGDCGEKSPAELSDEEKKDKGVVTQFPGNLKDALKVLEDDDGMKEILGDEVVQKYISVKRAEIDIVEGMGEEERKTWYMERY